MTAPATWAQHLDLEPKISNVAASRDFVATSLVEHGLDSLVDDVVLVVSELATNAIVHTGTSLTVTLRARQGLVVLEVRDGSTVAPVLGTPSGSDACGRGILIVAALSRDWGFVRHAGNGKSVWAEFNN